MGIVLAGILAVWTASEASAQGLSGGGGFTGGSSGLGGGGGLGSSGLGGGGLGSSGGGLGGGSRSTGGFSGGGFTGSTAFGGGTGSGTGANGATSYGVTSFMGRYYGNPLAIGVPTTSSTGATYLRAFPEQLTFGSPLYGTASLTTPVTTTPRTTTNPYQTSNIYGSAVTTTASAYGGASSAGVRRAPPYIAVPVFDRSPRPTAAAVQTNLQDIISRSTRLPSRNGINVSLENGFVVLRGRVRDERERRLAETVLRLSPGVYQVKNELIPAAKGTAMRQ
jgi:hypothetical protein